MLLWKRYGNNKMAAMRYYGNVILHLQQYSHRLNLCFIYLQTYVALRRLSIKQSLGQHVSTSSGESSDSSGA